MSCQQFMTFIMGQTESLFAHQYQGLEIMLVILSYILKKNIRIHAWNQEKKDMVDLTIINDGDNMQPTFLKLIVLKEDFSRGIKLEIICNQYEYDIFYRKSFPRISLGSVEEELKVSEGPPGLDAIRA